MTVMNTHSAIEQAQESPSLELLLFQLEQETYAIPSIAVREIIRYRSFTPVPAAPAMLPGILSQRGLILPIVEMRLLLGMSPAEITRATRLVVVSHTEIDFALLVDSVFDLTAFASSSIEPVPAALDPIRARYLQGIGQYEDQPVILLNLDEVIAGLREAT